jgi:hypothetical protein
MDWTRCNLTPLTRFISRPALSVRSNGRVSRLPTVIMHIRHGQEGRNAREVRGVKLSLMLRVCVAWAPENRNS